tara:strand:+ start:165828 stop:165998 length:171 start_codon:yes stop_codon:yes gene_type:complete
VTFKFRIGKDMIQNDETTSEATSNGWVQMWHTLGWIVLILASFSYCCRAEIVEILK